MEQSRVDLPVDDDSVPPTLRGLASWSWRLLVVGALVVVLWQIGVMFAGVLVPVLTGVLLTAMLAPFARFLRDKGFPSPLASVLSLLVILGVVFGIITLVGTQIASQWGQLATKAQEGINSVLQMLANSPLHIGQGQTQNIVPDVVDWLNRSRETVAGWLTSAGSGMVGFLAGTATALIATFFFLMEGHRFSTGMLKLLTPAARVRIEVAGTEGWKTLGLYVRAALTVAAIDGLTAGVGAAALGSNLFLALGALEFMLAFIPIVGNFVSAAVACGVVLVTLGPAKATMMLVIFIALMLLEGNLWQPLLLGRAADIHPLMILLGISVGLTLAGVVGALFAVPSVAFAIAFFRGLTQGPADRDHSSQPLPASEVSAGQLPDAGDGAQDLAAYLDPAPTRSGGERRVDKLKRQLARKQRMRRQSTDNPGSDPEKSK